VPDSPTRARFAALLTGVATGVGVLSCGSNTAPPPSSDVETPSPVTLPSFVDDYGLMLTAPPADRNLAGYVQRRGSCANPRSPAFFFPVGTFRGPDQPRHYDVDAYNRVGVSAILDAVREPSLSCRSLRSADFRFVWIRNMRQPLVVRVTIPDDRSLDAYALIDAPGYDGGTLVERQQRTLRDSERRQLIASLESANFWRMPSAFDPPFPDAESFLVEARVASAYHVVGRCLDKPSPFRELGELFIKIAGLPAPQD
jgi:hypothetical protein